MAEKLTIQRCLEQPCSTLMMAIPGVEIWAIRLFSFNLFARWHQFLWFKSWGIQRESLFNISYPSPYDCTVPAQ